ncbi:MULTISPECIES: hypothetical protein [unclassified Streptosporangium]|uniref:hypothetical protein n=1 Tax=unclassified Streptosporangium TaxID=2632669 RepID=UPI002E2924FE|nr:MULTISPECIES: hypothetical protein [unclassified Streptosporangium]
MTSRRAVRASAGRDTVRVRNRSGGQAVWATVARQGRAHRFFGNVHEAMADMP